MEKHKVHHDRKVRAANFSINDLVWVLDEQPNKSKFKKHWKPHPYRIIAKINDVTYKIKNTTKKSKRLIVNQCKLKKCFTTNAIDVDHQYNTTPEIKAEEQQFHEAEHPKKRGRPRAKPTSALNPSQHTTLVEQATTNSQLPQEAHTQHETIAVLPMSTTEAFSTEATQNSQDLEHAIDTTIINKRSDPAALNYEPNPYYAKQLANNRPGQRKSSRNKKPIDRLGYAPQS